MIDSGDAYFEATTGRLVGNLQETRPIVSTKRFIAGLHLLHFKHWTLRWLYFVLGLVGCVTIATGFMFWLESRRRKHEQLGLRGIRLVEGLATGSVTGLLIATVVFFVANRLLPLGALSLGQERAALEIWAFGLASLANFGHAWARPARAWGEQCRILAALALAAVLLNWLTTGDHLGRTLLNRHLWPVAGRDLPLLLLAFVVFVGVHGLRRRRSLAPRGVVPLSPKT